jgi:hypothetical protein
LTTPAIKGNFLVEQGFAKTVNFLEFIVMGMKGLAKDREREVHSGGNHALHNFVRFPDVNEV